MNRKLKQAIEVADFWVGLEVGCSFAEQQDESFLPFRDAEDYPLFS